MNFLNRCIWTAANSGLGDFVVSAAAQNGYTPAQCLVPAVVNGATYHYFATNGIQHEEGDGAYNTATNTLARTTIRNSSNSHAQVNFSAAPTVTMGGPVAADIFQNPLLVSTARGAPWDDFDVADGTALTGRVSASGHTWGTTGAGASSLVISKFGVINNGASVGYGWLSDSQLITEVEVVFSWQPAAAQVGANSGHCVVAFAGQNAGNLLQYMLHWQLNASGSNLLKTTTGPSGLAPLANPPTEVNGNAQSGDGSWYGTNLKIDGTRYKGRMIYFGPGSSKLWLQQPDGLVLQYIDPDIDTIMAACQTAFIEPDPDGIAGQATIGVNGFSFGPSKAGLPIEASSNKDTAILRGLFASVGARTGENGYVPRLTTPQVIPWTTNGWYTIATESAGGLDNKIGGVVTVFGVDADGRHALLDINVGTEISLSLPSQFTVVPRLGQVGGGVVDQIRLSQDNSGHHIQLDIHISTAAASLTLYAQYQGYFSPVTVPVVGASALGTWSVVQSVTFAAGAAQWNPSDKSSTMTISGSNLVATANANAEAQVRSTTSHSVGKFYAELTVNKHTSSGADDLYFGICSAAHSFSTFLGGTDGSLSVSLSGDGGSYFNHARTIASNVNLKAATGDVIAMAVDLINYKIWWKNLTKASNWNNSGTDNPATNTGGLDISAINVAPFFVCVNIETNTDQATVNLSGSFSGTVPAAGFAPWG